MGLKYKEDRYSFQFVIFITNLNIQAFLQVQNIDSTRTKNEITMTKNELTRTKNEITMTKNKLTMTKNDSTVTKIEMKSMEKYV